ncbi:DUF6867 family protein [Aquamicrobium sp. LC103]|uniref:DUF6867 family protein n=1 Tax=Aquamicrobium sp. LC103 TaxID=1120658 RepID=UPI00063E6EDB|nr:hypothetical protein [Aquamicrobium sp. LC103]TKT75471.1 hypothetical protein XW59_020335 [Aquamicrobium sp. LC103]
MEKEYSLLWEVTFWEFLFVTVALAGSAAYMTGRAIARSWQGLPVLAIYMVLLAAATRFIHFALFEGSLLTIHYYIVDLIVLLLIAFAGFRFTRGKQMARQYGFLLDGKGA